jgi:two-component system, cell cycle response regulator DivK
MIVEDNELNMKLFHDLLEAHGYRSVAGNQREEDLSAVTRISEVWWA